MIFRFAFVGILGLGLQFIFSTFLCEIFGITPIISVILSIFFVSIATFCMNSVWSFGYISSNTSIYRWLIRYLRYLGLTIFSMCINVSIFALLYQNNIMGFYPVKPFQLFWLYSQL